MSDSETGDSETGTSDAQTKTEQLLREVFRPVFSRNSKRERPLHGKEAASDADFTPRCLRKTLVEDLASAIVEQQLLVQQSVTVSDADWTLYASYLSPTLLHKCKPPLQKSNIHSHPCRFEFPSKPSSSHADSVVDTSSFAPPAAALSTTAFPSASFLPVSFFPPSAAGNNAPQWPSYPICLSGGLPLDASLPELPRAQSSVVSQSPVAAAVPRLYHTKSDVVSCLCISCAGMKAKPICTPCLVCGASIVYSVCLKLKHSAQSPVPSMCFKCNCAFLSP